LSLTRNKYETIIRRIAANGIVVAEHCFMAKLLTRWWQNPPVIVRYGVAVALVYGALKIEQGMEAQFVGAPVSLFLCAVMLSAWFGGFGPGLFAAALALLAFDYYFISPDHALFVGPEEVPRVVIFGLSVCLVGLLSAAQRRGAESLRHARDELNRAFQKLQRTNEALLAENAERKRVEEALRQSEQRFRDYAETASDWLWETGPDHRFVHISDHLKAFGTQPEMRMGRKRWDFAGDLEEEPEKWRAHIATHEARQPFRSFVYKSQQRADGSSVYVRTSGKPFFDPEGRFLGYRGVGSNITAEVQGYAAEKALRQAQVELEHVTRVTTLGELAASIIHEVNQPLAAIATNGEACMRFLNRDVPDLNEVHDAIVGMMADSRRAGEVILRIRALCRKAEPNKIRLDINDVINEVVLLIQRELIEHGVSLRRELSAAPVFVLGDRIELQQVTINLLMNGMEAMTVVTDRPRDLLIRTQQEADQVLVAIQDSGTGIEPENADRLFTSFFTTKPSGLGMGLSICRSIIEAHGGRLCAAPNAGPGATFQFTLPSD
jgi:PAS domain S-box-containing protein